MTSLTTTNPKPGNRVADVGSFFAKVARYATAGGVAGTIGLGLVGLRGTMRLLTITSGQVGVTTENGNRAGDFTLEGTAFLVGAGMLIGIVLGVLYGAIRKGFPRNIWVSSLLTAPLIARAVMLDPTNIDFNRFGPRWVAVVGFTFGCFVYTFVLDSGLRWLESHWRLPMWANFVLGVPPMVFLVAAVTTFAGLDLVRLIGVIVVAVLIANVARRPEWRQNLVKGFAALWVVGGIWIWLQSAMDLI